MAANPGGGKQSRFVASFAWRAAGHTLSASCVQRRAAAYLITQAKKKKNRQTDIFTSLA